MKKISIIFILLISQFAFSQTADQLRVFAEVMPWADVFRFPQESKKSFEVHLLDSHQIFPSWSDVKAKNLIPLIATKRTKGTMKYVKAFPMPYSYDVTYQAPVYTHEVRIYFIGATTNDKILFEKLLADAEKIWNGSKPLRDFAYDFKFKRTDDPWKAHYRVTVLNSTRGPYNVSWGRDWTGTVVAHELGHMMGIADEYETITGDQYCLPHSLMCASWKGQLMKHHYYFILRRLVATAVR